MKYLPFIGQKTMIPMSKNYIYHFIIFLWKNCIN